MIIYTLLYHKTNISLDSTALEALQHRLATLYENKRFHESIIDCSYTIIAINSIALGHHPSTNPQRSSAVYNEVLALFESISRSEEKLAAINTRITVTRWLIHEVMQEGTGQ
jgi:hypothetical protein